MELLTPAKRWSGVICILLIGVAIGAQAFHIHPNEFSSAAKHCTVCHVANTSIQVAILANVDFGFKTTAYLSFSCDPGHASVRAGSALYSRPPPAA